MCSSLLLLSLLLLACSSEPMNTVTQGTPAGAGSGGAAGATAGAAGQAGLGGAPSGGASGGAGAGGSAGEAGVGGVYGSSGQAGAGGDPGSSGQAGSGGISGSSGQAGAGAAGEAGVGGEAGAGGGALVCPASIDERIASCIQDRLADPELSPQEFLLDTLLACADAEPVAAGWDAHCAAAPADPICAIGYPAFVEQVLPECVARVQASVFEGRCVLPAVFREVRFARALSPLGRQVLTAPDGASEVERAQILAAGRVASADLASADAVFAYADEGILTRERWLELGTNRVLVSLVFHAGDNLFGAFFFDGTSTRVARVYDSDVLDCTVERVARMSPCAAQSECEAGLSCQGVVASGGQVIGQGLCVSTTPAEGEGSACGAPDACDAAAGLVCLDLGAPPADGQCRPGWQRGRFPGPSAELPPGATTHQVEQVLSGLATVATSVRVNAVIAHPAPASVRVWVQNPASSEALVFDGAKQEAPNGEINLAGVPVPTPGDESANGTWKLRIEDASSSGGTVLFWDLEVSTRFD